ncbi:hypothetical protein [Paenibacillus nasutitermitis]|uniref:Uncharacterized protein n=1 Tax=Paenibacillus nasutitermitis TaxID=1652958 RepID=A0A916ZH43_9BACL|nr:hypothetical protein [Paenibacillus nasutitermitis]GGD97588.1 hypothetical protein GCM10010911_65410 [Paenibacillus nasutitermitis]
MLYKAYAGVILVFATLVLYSVFIFDRDRGEQEWRQAQAERTAEFVFTNFEDWTVYNISKKESEWTSTTNDPILIGPSMEISQAKQTYFRIQLSVNGEREVQVFWRGAGESFSEAKSKVFSGKTIESMVDGDVEQLRIDPAMKPGADFIMQEVRIEKYR